MKVQGIHETSPNKHATRTTSYSVKSSRSVPQVRLNIELSRHRGPHKTRIEVCVLFFGRPLEMNGKSRSFGRPAFRVPPKTKNNLFCMTEARW